MDKAIKIQNGVESQPKTVGVESRVEACRGKPTEKGFIHTGNKVYSPQLTSTYKETKILEDLNNNKEWVFRDQRRYLNQAKDPRPPRDYVMGFVGGLTQRIWKRIYNYRYDKVTQRTRSKRCSWTTGISFVKMDYASISREFHSRLTQVPPTYLLQTTQVTGDGQSHQYTERS